MKSPIPDYLANVLNQVRPVETGAVADYIEALAEADPSKMAVALATVDGNLYSAGDDQVEFSIQSISKAFVYALAIEDQGLERVLDLIGVEPSGDAFNKLSLQKDTSRPMNPMINAGAIATHSLVVGPDATAEQRIDRILTILSKLAGRQLFVDEAVYEAEYKDANRNLGLGYMLKAAGVITGDPHEIVRGYIRQCSISVNVRDLAVMAATLSNGGVHPISGEVLMPHQSARQLLSVMTTCGMYDAAGDWVSRVGIPAKSGVAGGIIGALPGQVGLAVFSPKLDEKGNSVRGVLLCEKLSSDMGLHMMDISQVGRATVRLWTLTMAGGEEQSHGHEQEVPVFGLRGAVRFAGAERLTRAIVRELGPPDDKEPDSGRFADACAVIFSFKDTYSLNNVAQRIIREDIHRLIAAGKNVVVIDPCGVLKRDENSALESDLPRIVMDEVEARHYIGGKGCRTVSHSDSW
jgi:glutaminase